MVIFLDKQRPPKKKMGRKQRKGSKSNPGSGVQWANWLDDPAGAPGGGGGGGTPPVLSAVVPATLGTDAGIYQLEVAGTGFVPTSVVYADATALVTTYVSAIALTATYDPATAGTVQFTVHNGAAVSAAFPVTVVVADDPEATTAAKKPRRK